MDAQKLCFNFWLKREIFLFSNASRMAVGAIQPPMQWLPGFSIHGGMEDSTQPTTHLPPVVRLRMSGVIPPPSICLHGIQRKNFTFTFPCCNALHSPRREDERIYR